jgi:hypothetical protein
LILSQLGGENPDIGSSALAFLQRMKKSFESKDEGDYCVYQQQGCCQRIQTGVYLDKNSK